MNASEIEQSLKSRSRSRGDSVDKSKKFSRMQGEDFPMIRNIKITNQKMKPSEEIIEDDIEEDIILMSNSLRQRDGGDKNNAPSIEPSNAPSTLLRNSYK